MIRCNSEADSKVWMKEDDKVICMLMRIFDLLALKCFSFQSFLF